MLLRDYQGELTVTVVPTGYLWRETAYASLLQFSPPILEHISAIKTKLGKRSGFSSDVGRSTDRAILALRRARERDELGVRELRAVCLS